MTPERITFHGTDGQALSARLDRPAGPARATALFAHCFTCGKDIPAARRIAAALAAQGFAVLRFDFTGLGHSAGEFANTSFTSNVDDLVAAAEYLRGRDLSPGLLIGHSLGGAAVLRAAHRMPSVTAVATIGAPYDPGHVTHNFAGALDEIRETGQAEVDLGGRPFTIGKRLVDDLDAQELTPAIADLGRALLVCHAPRDAIVGIDNARDIFMTAKHPKSFVSLDDADHLVTKADDADYVARVIATWAARYVALAPEVPKPAAPEGITRVTEADPGGFLQDVSAGHHHLVADEPVRLGGTDLGPTPYNLLAAALGTCTTMTLRMYARRKKIPLDGVEVDVTHEKCHLADAEADTDRRVDVLTRVIRLSGDLTGAQRDRLLEIADKCPVHRTLEAGARVETRLDPEG